MGWSSNPHRIAHNEAGFYIQPVGKFWHIPNKKYRHFNQSSLLYGWRTLNNTIWVTLPTSFTLNETDWRVYLLSHCLFWFVVTLCLHHFTNWLVDPFRRFGQHLTQERESPVDDFSLLSLMMSSGKESRNIIGQHFRGRHHWNQQPLIRWSPNNSSSTTDIRWVTQGPW